MSRQNFIYIIVGGIGSGKTTNTKRLVNKILDNNESINKLVVFDDGDYDNWESLKSHHNPERGNQKLPIIKEEDLLRLKSGHVRIIQKRDDYTTYVEKFSKLRNSVLVIEDASRWIEAESKVPGVIKKLFLNVKQRNVELFFTFHDLQDVPSWFARKARVIILHHTGDTVVPKKLDKPAIRKAFEALQTTKKTNQYDFKVIPVNVDVKS
ncbi:hypothetical protein [Brumimicrobium mesophilum]|uniref:hypothetical protein n=1 Tax=Brumimicrobium mesophilum TaxID=392717 RepID=UPI000D141DF1|nr:hypothetical protein [Brumimicrobium mesophilum]